MEERRAILARRRRLVAAALATLAAPVSCTPAATAQRAPPSRGGSASPAPTPTPAPVPDSDGDGITDDVDRCPSAAGVEGRDPDEMGCPPRPCLSIVMPSTIRIVPKIHFPIGSDALRPETTLVVDEIARGLAEHPELQVEVVGHRDPTEAPALALARAEVVRHALEARGIDAARLTTTGVADNEKGRYVEFEVIQP